jgi:hypothetical protein
MEKVGSYHRYRVEDMYGVLIDCAEAKNMAYEQFALTVTKYLAGYPESRGYAMPNLFWSATRGVCEKFPHPKTPVE